MAKSKRRFGRVRKLPSGRWQARYPGPDGIDRPAPETFRTKTDADVWLVNKETEIRANVWVDPDAGQVTVGDYAEQWIKERRLAESTVAKYREYLLRFVVPYLGSVAVGDLTPARIRTWYTQLEADGATDKYRAKTYRFLHAVLNTAADDEVIRRNPCRIKGAGQEYSPERPVLSVAQVLKVAGTIQPRYRLLVLLAAFVELRYSELVRLKRADIDVVNDVIAVLPSDKRGKSKTLAGVRKVAIPSAIMPALRFHLKIYAEPEPTGRVFVGPKGATPSNANFNGIGTVR